MFELMMATHRVIFKVEQIKRIIIMKLRNLFLASLAVCTMASCSKDDDGISGPQEVDAYLSFASTTDVMTKASTEGDDDAGNGQRSQDPVFDGLCL